MAPKEVPISQLGAPIQNGNGWRAQAKIDGIVVFGPQRDTKTREQPWPKSKNANNTVDGLVVRQSCLEEEEEAEEKEERRRRRNNKEERRRKKKKQKKQKKQKKKKKKKKRQ